MEYFTDTREQYFEMETQKSPAFIYPFPTSVLPENMARAIMGSKQIIKSLKQWDALKALQNGNFDAKT